MTPPPAPAPGAPTVLQTERHPAWHGGGDQELAAAPAQEDPGPVAGSTEVSRLCCQVRPFFPLRMKK